MQNKQAKINKRKVLEITKLDWAGMGYSPIVESNAATYVVQGYYFFDPLLKRSFGEPSGTATVCFFFCLLI